MPAILISTNTKMALDSIKGNKTRSLLTMLGIIIGVSSVILTVSLGEGLRRQVNTTNQGGNDQLVIVRSGSIIKRSDKGAITEVNYLASLGSNTLTEEDYTALTELSETKTVVPLATISGLPTDFDGNAYEKSLIVATTSALPKVINQKVVYGSFFQDDTSGRNSVVIGKRVAEELFHENVPLGKLISVRGQDFVVGGVFDEFTTNPLNLNTDLNKAVFISYPTAKTLVTNPPVLFQFMMLPADGVSPDSLRAASEATLLKSHGMQDDFTVLKASEAELIAQNALSVATSFIAGIAAISLIVGGVGIMNIMFVSVTERTREIGIRKSLGATNSQIRNQFMIEATVLSIVGGMFGVLVAFIGNICLRLFTNLTPAITWEITLIAVGVSAAVGMVFGTVPAIKAARKDPIQSLRYE